ncbi:MAG: SigE family RNA polymerase sigma factor [Mycobacteriales bacterium]
MAEATEDLMARLFYGHYRRLLRLAAMLIDEPGQCEEVVQEAFTRVFASRSRLRDPDSALAYLRQTVVNLSRSALRRRMVAAKHTLPWALPAVSAEDEAYEAIERDAVIAAVRRLPTRSREAVMLRFYADLSIAETADVMGISAGAVKSYTSRGLDALAAILEEAK